MQLHRESIDNLHTAIDANVKVWNQGFIQNPGGGGHMNPCDYIAPYLNNTLSISLNRGLAFSCSYSSNGF